MEEWRVGALVKRIAGPQRLFANLFHPVWLSHQDFAPANDIVIQLFLLLQVRRGDKAPRLTLSLVKFERLLYS